MEKKGLTVTVIFEAESANYGEGLGNVTALKKLSRGNGESYSYISRQALRFNLVNQMSEMSDKCKLAPIGKPETKESTLQFSPSATIKEHFEIDLFGYMKTVSKKKDAKTEKIDNEDEPTTTLTRNAVVRLSNATALESFNGDLDYMVNKWMFDRLTEKGPKHGANIAQSEIHRSFYTYTISVDLDKIGVENDEDKIEKDEKYFRISLLLKAAKYLYRDIKGRRENLAPLFAIGGVYDIKNPFFLNIPKLQNGKLCTERLKSTIDKDDLIKDNTFIGYVENSFINNEEIKSLKPVPLSIKDFFNNLDQKVKEYYGASCNKA